MRGLLVLIITMLVGCGSAAKQGPASAGTADSTAPPDTGASVAAADTAAPTAEAASASAAEPVDLVRGNRVKAHGLELMLRSTGTTHPSTSVTVSRAEIEADNGQEKRTISLEREQPGDAKFVDVLGVQMALDSVDASAKPSTARILVRK